jgi:NADH:ubiquinone oxidoreductase subunit D
MFDDRHGDPILVYPHVTGFSIESMHVVGGGVHKDVNEGFKTMAQKAKLDITDDSLPEISILETHVDEHIAFLNDYTVTEQQRKLRYLYNYELCCTCHILL